MPAQLDLFSWSEFASAVQQPSPAPPPPPRVPERPAAVLVGSAAGLVWPLPQAELKKSLHDYQQRLREATHDHFAAHQRGMVVAATGAGKTVFFSALAADVVQAGGRVLILTDQQELVDQAIEKLAVFAGLYGDAEQAERTASPSARVVVATVQSMGTRLQKYPPDHFALVVADECDRAVAAQWQKVLRHFDGTAKVLGVTATPKRSDRKNVLKYFGAKIAEVPLLELINRGYLVPINVQEVPITIDLTEVEDATGESAEYDPTALGHAVEKIFSEVCEAMQEYAPKLKTLVFCPDVATSKKFVLEAHRQKLNARHIDATSPNRRELKQGFRDWKWGTKDLSTFQVLSNPVLLSRGYDDKSIECIVNLRPAKSVSLYQQIIGRGTRLYCPWGCGGPCEHPERKRSLLVLDFLYQFKEMGPVKPASLFTDDERKAQEMQAIIAESQGALDLREVMAEAEANIEAALVRAIEEAMNKTKGKKGEYYNALQFAATLHIPDVLDYVPETDAEAAPVPEKVRKRLSKAGFIPDTVPYLGLAQKLLAAVKARHDAGLASCKQVFWLRKWGYQDAWDMDREQANKICTRKFARY